ncbi:MAG TPA: glycosyltransferase [Rudaea sp.]|nr:glycosyltransferase [Rudaea sp.]
MVSRAEIASTGDDGSGSVRIEWLGWDGRELSWRVHAARGTPTALCLDGVPFAPFAGTGDGAHVHACAFEYSPTGNDELEFSIAAPAAARPIRNSWRVRFGAAAAPAEPQWTHAAHYLAPLAGTPRLPPRAWSDLPAIAVVVPIHNAPQSVRRCLAALERWTPRLARLILIDDASTDPEIGALLEPFARRANTRVLRSERNRGYTHNVNAGMQLAGDADVVLLNSDTEVGPRWLQSLRLAAYGEDSIGTVTAVSDNAGAFSVPDLEQYCPIPEKWDLPGAQRAVLQQAGMRFPELPTGNGFCMFVKRELINRIGTMDAQAFPAGYGEENDFCQRAELAGYRNIVAGHVLVRHERSASFGDARRAALGVQGMAVLRQRYPNYEADVSATLYSFARRVLDYRVRRTYADSDGRYADRAPRSRVLIAMDDGDGLDLAAPDEKIEAFSLRQHGRLQLYCHASDWQCVAEATADTETAGAAAATDIRAWLLAYAIEYVLVPAAGTLDERVAAAAGSLGIPVVRRS